MTASASRTIHSQPAYLLESDTVSLAVSRLGGHLAPVTFGKGGVDAISPYYVSPWQDEGHPSMPAPVLRPLRGDFFCLPFGGNAAAFKGEQHPPHGETASAEWSFESDVSLADGTSRLVLSLETKVRPGRVTKEIFLRPGQPVVYQRHLIEGFAGPTPLGHHATLAMPDTEGVFALSTSPFRLGMTNPGVFSDPASGEYQALALGATFTDLGRVPSLFKEPAEVDCSRLPARRGYADLLAVVADVAALAGKPAWTAAVNTREHWAWFSLRNPAVLPMTVFWLENRGRHTFPWNGRNQCLGLEDVCAFFADGLGPSAEPNLLSRQGIATVVELTADHPADVRSIQAATPVPVSFDRVAQIEFTGTGVVLVDAAGEKVHVPLNHAFVTGTGDAP
jgi:hypothetical protein